MGQETHEYDLLAEDEAQDLPRVVEEAHEILAAYSWQLSGVGALVVAGAVVAALSGAGMSAVILLPILLILGLLYVSPMTREPRLAREVLRRWDELRIERALESSGLSADPRLEVAESMAHRIVRHPSVDDRTRAVTSAMVNRLRRLLHDARRTSYWLRIQVASEKSDVSRSMSDLQDLIDARVADVLARLADLHRAVVLRDSESLERVIAGVEDLVRELEAEVEVERLLSSAEQER